MAGAPRSKEFDDVYFSDQDGWAETQHVFIKSNGLPEAWEGRGTFAIAETGFGTGLNFLCAWRLWNETNASGKLHFITFEKFPLSKNEIRDAMERWREHFPRELETLLANYSAKHTGPLRIDMGQNCALTLIVGNVNEEIPKLQVNVDCWFLDGFKPATNPDMWTDIVFQNMARLSKPGATFATFTAAGFVKRGLRAAGFEVKKIQGYGTKRDMLAGVKL